MSVWLLEGEDESDRSRMPLGMALPSSSPGTLCALPCRHNHREENEMKVVRSPAHPGESICVLRVGHKRATEIHHDDDVEPNAESIIVLFRCQIHHYDVQSSAVETNKASTKNKDEKQVRRTLRTCLAA